jgi:hypothetical protein
MPRKNLNESEHPSLWTTVAGASVLLPARSTVNDAEVTVCEQAMFAMLVYFVMLMRVVMREAVARLPAEGRRHHEAGNVAPLRHADDTLLSFDATVVTSRFGHAELLLCAQAGGAHSWRAGRIDKTQEFTGNFGKGPAAIASELPPN